MNYYEKIIQEKNNTRDYDEINKVYKEAKRIVDDLRRKYREISGRERDDGNFLYSIIEEKGMPTDSGDQQKAKHAAGLLESVRRMSTTPRDWGNSKEEKGYYAKLAEEKKNTNPEDSMRKLQALKPIVEAFKRKGMTRHEVAMRLMQERDITETLAQQCVDTWY